MQIPVTISNPTKTLLGMLHIPTCRNPNSPIIIMCYGMNGNRVENHRLARDMAICAEKEGLIFLRFDYYGLGISSGEYSEVTLETKVDDVLLCIEFIKGCLQRETYSIVLIGYSDGAKVAAKVFEKSKMNIMLCFWNPVLYEFSFEDKSEEKSLLESSIKLVRDPITKKLTYPLPYTGLLMSVKYLRSLSDNSFDMLNLFAQSNKKIFIFGKNDDKSKRTFKECLIAKSKHISDDNEIFLIENCDHLFSDVISSKKVIEQTISWIKGELK